MSGNLPRISLGDRVRDPITKFEGIAVCRIQWLHGCVRFCVQMEQLDKDHKTIEHSFDEAGLELVEAGVITAAESIETSTDISPGGPYRRDADLMRRDIPV